MLRDPEGYNTNGTLIWDTRLVAGPLRRNGVQSQGEAVLNLRPGKPMPDVVQKENFDLIGRLNEAHRRQYPAESELETRIRNYELAARMQLSASEVLDLSKESAATRRLYGLEAPVTESTGAAA